MRLLLAVDSAVWGGAEACVGHLLHELPARFQCTVMATDPVPARLVEAATARGRLEVVAPVRDKTDVRGLWTQSRALARARPDLVHVNQAQPTNNRHLLGLAIARRVPAVAALHLWGRPPASRVQSRVLRATYQRAGAVITVSREMQALVVRDLGVDPARVYLVRNGVGPLPAAPTRLDARPLVLGAMGRLVDHKGFDVLLEAVRRLCSNGCDVQVLLAGDGPALERLQAAAAGLPVTFVGAVPDGPAFLSRLDVFVLPSRAEGLPLALLEALTMGLACVVTDVGDVREAVGDTAVVVPPDDPGLLAAALAGLIDEPGTRQELGAAARHNASLQANAGAMARATASVYDAVLRHNGRHP